MPNDLGQPHNGKIRNNCRFEHDILDIIIHQIFLARAIGLNTSRDEAKTGKYQMIFPK